MFMTQAQGWVEVITGCMFSGKSEELLRRVRRIKIAKQEILLFKPKVDNRYDPDKVVSHSGEKLEAIAVENSKDITEYVRKHGHDFDAIAIDEVQFFDNEVISVCQHFANTSKRIIIAGLDKDFMGRPFGPMPQLLAIAEHVTKLHAICMKCGNPASFSMKKISDDSMVQIGSDDIYEPRCRACYRT